MPIFKAIDRPGKSVKNVINYAAKDSKKEKDESLFYGVNCADNPVIAAYQMQKTKELYGKTDGRQYKHYVLSFAPDEIDINSAKEYAKKLAEKCFGDRYEVAVSFIDGKKLHFAKSDLENFKNLNDKIAKKYNLKIIDRSKEAVKARGRPQMYSQAEYQQFSKKIKESWIAQCAAAHQALKNKPKDFVDFGQQMQAKGWRVQVRGKNITFVSITDKNKKVRANTLAQRLNNNSINTANILRACNVQNWRDFIKKPKTKSQIKTQKVVLKTKAATALKNLAQRGNTTTKGGMRVRLRDTNENEI